MLTAIGTNIRINNISNQLRQKLQKKLDSLLQQYPRKRIKYKFDIGHKNPDPENHSGKIIYPSLWQLAPVSFRIDDHWTEKVGDEQVHHVDSVLIGIPSDRRKEDGDPEGFKCITLVERDGGIFEINLDTAPGRANWAYLELHPENGVSFNMVDDKKDAKRRIERRRTIDDARNVAVNMTIKEGRDFAAAMGWDEFEDEEILMDRVQQLAENDPEFFTQFFDTKHPAIRAIVTRAETNGLITFVPTEYKYVWTADQSLIVAFGRQEGFERLSAMTDWLVTDSKGAKILEKLEALLKVKAK